MSLSPVIVLIAALAQSPAQPPARAASPDEAQATGAVAAPAPADADDEDDLAPPTPTAPLPYEAPSVRPFEMTGGLPTAPVPYAVDENIPDAPVTVDAYHRSYEGPPDGLERAYQAGIKRSFDAQQVRMGPLDGPWLVRTQGGAAFMALMLADQGRADQEIEGAWRSLANRPGQGHSGFLLSVGREGQTLVVRWYPSDDTGNITVMRLNPTSDGRWTGQVRAGDVEFPVTMARAPQVY